MKSIITRAARKLSIKIILLLLSVFFIEQIKAQIMFDQNPDNLVIGCDQDIPAEPEISATSNCGEVTIQFSANQELGDCPNSYTITRTWIASDQCGNAEQISQTITVQDILAPTFIDFPANLTVTCGQIPQVASPAATDNCDASVTVVYNGNENNLVGCTQTIQRSWTATDACGNQTTAIQTILVKDTIAPVIVMNNTTAEISCSELDLQSALDGNFEEVRVLFAELGLQPLSVTDNCCITSWAEAGIEVTEGECPNLASFTISYVAVDHCDNYSDTIFTTLNIVDITSPILSCPGNIEIACGGELPEPLIGVEATDNCTDVTIMLFNEITSGSGCDLQYQRTYRAYDACGNFAECVQTISIGDATDPILEGNPEDITVECSAIPEPGVYTATDNCDENVLVVYSFSILDGECENDYTILRRWIATDDCGNAATISQSVSVFDNTAPVIVCPPNLDLECISDVPTPLSGVEATDNCSDVSLFLFNEIVSGTGCNLSYTRTYRAYDACGNFAECTQIITTLDETPPVINGDPEDLTVSCDSVPEPVNFTATDNCSENVLVSFSQAVLDGDCESGYLILRRWIATDDCGNSVTVSQGIDVGGNPGIIPIDGNTLKLSASPNPTKGNTNFTFKIPYNSNVQFNITTPQGVTLPQIFSGKVNANQEINATFNSEQVSAGIYFYTLVTDKESKSGRLVVID